MLAGGFLSLRLCGSSKLRSRVQVSERPFRALFTARMLYIPAPLKNYGLALLGMPFGGYVAATLAAECVRGVLVEGGFRSAEYNVVSVGRGAFQ